MKEDKVVMYDGFYPIFTTIPTTPATEEFKLICVQNHIGATVMDLYQHYFKDKPFNEVVIEFLSSNAYRELFILSESNWRDSFAITRDSFLSEMGYEIKKIPKACYEGNDMDRPLLGAVTLVSDCLYAYSKHVYTSLKEAAKLFDKYKLFDYLINSYEKLSELSLEKVVNDVISKKIKEGVVFI